MKITFYVCDDLIVANFFHKGIEHFSADIRDGFFETSIHFSKRTMMDKTNTSMKNLYIESTESGEAEKYEVDLKESHFEIQEGYIGGIYIENNLIPFIKK